MQIRTLVLSALLWGTAAAVGCDSSLAEVGSDRPSADSAGDGALNGGSSSGGTSTGGTDAGCRVATCQGKTYACGNCADDDRDGKLDMDDPDCLGPCHDAEDTFYISISAQSETPCIVDCYFDQDSEPGNDGCRWNQQCDPLSVAPKYPPAGDRACAYDPDANTPGTSERCGATDAGPGLHETQSAQCQRVCVPLTPNGCDCFGCCELPAGAGNYVWLGSKMNKAGTCAKADLSKPDKCRPCTPVEGCLNPCDKCELCLGKDTLPDECTAKPPDAGSAGSGGAVGALNTCDQTCLSGSAPCGGSCGVCSDGYFCLTGCCIAVPR
jgi:hypothetical protein